MSRCLSGVRFRVQIGAHREQPLHLHVVGFSAHSLKKRTVAGYYLAARCRAVNPSPSLTSTLAPKASKATRHEVRLLSA